MVQPTLFKSALHRETRKEPRSITIDCISLMKVEDLRTDIIAVTLKAIYEQELKKALPKFYKIFPNARILCITVALKYIEDYT